MVDQSEGVCLTLTLFETDNSCLIDPKPITAAIHSGGVYQEKGVDPFMASSVVPLFLFWVTESLCLFDRFEFGSDKCGWSE